MKKNKKKNSENNIVTVDKKHYTKFNIITKNNLIKNKKNYDEKNVVLINKLNNTLEELKINSKITKDDFIKKEIFEISKIHNMNGEEIFNEFKKGKLDSNHLIRVENEKIRGVVYEFLWIFTEEIFNNNLIIEIKDSLEKAKNSKERGYLSERKQINFLKQIFKYENGEDFDYFNFKLSFIIARRIVFLQNLNFEFEQPESIEISTLLQQIITDINCYFLTLLIKHKKTELVDLLNEFYLKSFIFRILFMVAKKSNEIAIELKRIENKSIYFLKSKCKGDRNFAHFYSKVLLTPPIILFYNNIGLNGGYHYLNKRRIIEPNLYNNKVEIVETLLKFVEKQNKLKFFLDDEMINLQKNDVLEKLEKDKEINKELLNLFPEIGEVAYSEVNQMLNFQSHKKKMKKFFYIKNIDNLEELNKTNKKIEELKTKKKKKLNNLEKLEKKKKFLEDLIQKGKLTKNYENEKKWIQKDFSYVFIIKIYLEFVEFFKNYKFPLYYAIYFDFRGRYYYNSLTSPDKGWPFRFIYNFGVYEKKNNEKKLNFLINHKKYEKFLNKLNFVNLNDEKINAILWILLSIGSITITKKENIKEEEFIEEGLKNYLSKKEINDYLENSELKYYYLIIKNIEKENNKNRYLLKDISGSIFQNASIILGLKNIENLKYLNLNNEEWWDPYFPLINEIKKNIDKNYENFFSRKTLKKPIMTRYYNSTLFTSFKYFIIEVRKMKEYKEEYFNDIWKNFKKVFNLMKNLEKKLLFENSNEDYNHFLNKEKIKKANFDDFKFELTSYELISKRIDITVDGKRVTTTTCVQSIKEFSSKNKNSKIPNIFHAEDSRRARELISNLNGDCFSIHDAFAVSVYEVDELIIKANELFNINTRRKFYMGKNNIENKIFSKFIIL